MDALLMQGSGHLSPGSEPERLRATPEAKSGRAATIFAAIYLALVLGSPFLVRYGPSTDDHSMAALATRMEQPRCASATAKRTSSAESDSPTPSVAVGNCLH